MHQIKTHDVDESRYQTQGTLSYYPLLIISKDHDVSTIFRGPRRNSAEEGDHKISLPRDY